jgi:class 3 adenylate cyclase
MRALRFEGYDHFAVQPAELWPFVSDTARLNHAIGLFAVDFTAEPRDDGGSVVVGEFRRFGLTLARWTEHAFNFVRPLRYNVLREYSRGPLVRLDGGVDMTPDSDGTIVRVWSEIQPRNPLGYLLARFMVGPQSTIRVLAQCRIFEEVIVGRRENPFPQLSANVKVNERQLDEMMTRLGAADCDITIAGKLRHHLSTAPADRVVQMRPFELADAWGTDRTATLVTFLQATTVGLLKLVWEVLCPNCRVSKAEFASLSSIGPQGHCDVCNIVFDTNFDRLVEVRFTVAPSIREADVSVYCVGGPQNMPHVVAQAELGPGEAAAWPVPDGVSVLRLRSPQAPNAVLIDVDDSSSPHDGGARDGHAGQAEPPLVFMLRKEGLDPSSAQLAEASALITVKNNLPVLSKLTLEERFWPDTAATAALVSTLQEFHDLFAADVLAPGIQVGIERLAILFTDVAGSTMLYEQVGQARAFRVVQDHFFLIQGAVRANRGVMVKTIGDAIMAVFPTGAQALRAAFQMQRSMANLETYGSIDPQRFLRVGIHSGPCLAVTLNDRMDYFGTAVNVASRVEHEAAGGEIVLTRDAFDEPGVSDVLDAECDASDECDVQLRGLSGATRIVRIPASADIIQPTWR